MSSLADRAMALVQQLRDASRYHEGRGNHPMALRLAEKAEEVQGLAALAKLAEERLGPYAGPSSGSEIPPPMPLVPVQVKTPRERAQTRGRRGRPNRLEQRR